MMNNREDKFIEKMKSTEGLNVSQQLKDAINAEFNTSKGFYHATDHPFFCVKCAGKSLTPPEAEACRALNHIVFQAMKCSGIYGYLKSDIDKIKKIENVNSVCAKIKEELNVDHVCAFSVNNAMIYFPKTRTQKSLGSDNVSIDFGSKCCMTCGFDLKNRNQIKTDLFCSILCKLKCKNIGRLLEMVENSPASRNVVKLPLKRDSKKMNKKNGGDKKKKNKSLNNSIVENNEYLEILSSIANNDGNRFSTSIFSLRKRSRKGVHRVPTRAPLK